MSSLDILKSKYKPYRYTINNNVTIVESSSGKFVIKKQNKDLIIYKQGVLSLSQRLHIIFVMRKMSLNLLKKIIFLKNKS